MKRDRQLLTLLLKGWAQDHDYNFQINDPASGDDGLVNTGSHLTWLIQEKGANLDLLGLLDRFELLFENRRAKKHPDGMYCKKCQNFYQYAEPNQDDGSLLCYSCRANPYR